MRIFSLLSAILLLLNVNLQAQKNKLFPFKINGSINVDTGTIQLKLLVDKEYYPEGVQNLRAKIINKKFFFRGYIPYPQGIQLSYGAGYLSNSFIIAPGTQSIILNIDSNRKVPEVQNLVMKEYYSDYIHAFKEINLKSDKLYQKWDSLNILFHRKIPEKIKLDLEKTRNEYYGESDKTLLQYVASHPNSYVAFWKFIELCSFSGYENIFDSILSQFSDSLKNTYTGKVLSNKLKIASKLGFGKKFPSINCINIQNKKLDPTSFLKNEYTLVDLWYSNCGPCIAQFPDLKNLYEKYKGKGFEIVGVSTDKVKYKTDWQNAIKKHQLVWPQYWDINGQEAAKLSINAFPTNFLLDSRGIIIKKNLRPPELKQFLLENIK